MSLYGWHPAAPRESFPVQRDCERAACKALGIQCQERRSNMPCKEAS